MKYTNKCGGSPNLLYTVNDRSNQNSAYIERFSNDCRKTKTKAITPTNHNRSKQRDEPIRISSNYL